MNFDKSTRRRLSDLARGTANRPLTLSPQPSTPRPLRTVGEAHEVHGALEELLPGLVRRLALGEYYELVTPVAQVGEWALEALAPWQQAAAEGRNPGGAGNPDPAEVVFFDTETTGLNHTPLFLVGLLCHDGPEPCVRQLLARDYAEEAPLLEAARQLLGRAALLVSYNGTTFDLPYLTTRLRYHRLDPLSVAGHLDLLPVARHRYGRTYGNCKLQTLERHVCGRERCADIAGADIPQAYHDFVADGDACRLKRIIEHNLYDVITLAELTGHLADQDASQLPLGTPLRRSAEGEG